MKLTLNKTCSACPEQYDVFYGATYVGYMRLRHGCFSADNAEGTQVYFAETEGEGFFEDAERDYHLTRACLAIIADMTNKAPESIYEVVEDMSFTK